MRLFLTVTPWIVVEVGGERLEARWSVKPTAGSYQEARRVSMIHGPGFSFDRRLLGITGLSIMSGIMEASAAERQGVILHPPWPEVVLAKQGPGWLERGDA